MHCGFVGKISFVLIKMHGKTTIKVTDAQQAKLRNNYKNTKLKLHSVFVGKNSFVLIKIHGKTTIKIAY